jgi:superfamily I DNA/RNA helicase
LAAFPQYTLKDFIDLKHYIHIAEDIFKKKYLIPKIVCWTLHYKIKFLRSSDSRVDDDNFSYKDWSLAIYDKARNMMEDPVKVYKKETYKKEALNIFLRKIDTYEHYKRSGGENSFIDFTDMIGRAIDEVEFPPLDILILDEAQDFTPLQWSVIYKMCDNVKRIYLAGDDDQAIYRWNGGRSKVLYNILSRQKGCIT